MWYLNDIPEPISVNLITILDSCWNLQYIFIHCTYKCDMSMLTADQGVTTSLQMSQTVLLF